MNSIQKRLNQIQSDIKQACLAANRSQDEIMLLAVSKKHSADEVRQLFNLGVTHFGESYWQEAEDKLAELADLAISWHFIGPIQSNKTKHIAQHFSWVHSVDSVKVAKRLDQQRPSDLPPINVLIQVNIDREETKSGLLPQEIELFLKQVNSLERLNICGLMCIPKNDENEQQIRDSFVSLRKLRDDLIATYPTLTLLSMGMSKDFPIAIQEGSDLVRIGTALFGPRST